MRAKRVVLREKRVFFASLITRTMVKTARSNQQEYLRSFARGDDDPNNIISVMTRQNVLVIRILVYSSTGFEKILFTLFAYGRVSTQQRISKREFFLFRFCRLFFLDPQRVARQRFTMISVSNRFFAITYNRLSVQYNIVSNVSNAFHYLKWYVNVFEMN